MNGAETMMTVFRKARAVHRLASATALAAIACGAMVAAAPRETVRLVGVSAQASGKTAAVLIEATEPVAYAVSRPDPLTVLVDLRDVALGDASSSVTRKGPVAGVTLEQPSAGSVRVKIALSSPSAYKVRSARNVIRLELEPEMAAAAPAALDDLTASLRAPKAAAATDPAKAGKVEGAAAVRTTPADLKKGTEKSDDGCGHGKMAASDA